MCFSATANFVGSGVLGAIGVVTLTRVKHRRELLFASLPALFAIHQFIEGFVWLGLDGILSPAVAHDMGAAFMLYAQGLLPFLLPLSVLLFESDRTSRTRMLPFLVLGGATTLYILWALTAFPIAGLHPGKQHRLRQSGDQQYSGRGALCDCDLRFAVFLEGQGDGDLRRGKPDHSSGRHGGQALRLHLALVCVRGDRECDHPRLLLEKPRRPAVPLRIAKANRKLRSQETGCATAHVNPHERLPSRITDVTFPHCLHPAYDQY